MDLSAPATWAALYAAGAVGYAISRSIAFAQAREELMAEVLPGARPAYVATLGVVAILGGALVWPAVLIRSLVRRRRRTPPRGR